MNKINDKIKFIGLEVLKDKPLHKNNNKKYIIKKPPNRSNANNTNFGLIFNDFGKPLHDFCYNNPEYPFENRAVFEIIKKIAKFAKMMIENEIVIDFLHPTNVFILNEEHFILPNSYFGTALTESAKIENVIFQAPEYSEEKLEPEKLVAYSLGVLALYLRGMTRDNNLTRPILVNKCEYFGAASMIFKDCLSESNSRISLNSIIVSLSSI